MHAQHQGYFYNNIRVYDSFVILRIVARMIPVVRWLQLSVPRMIPDNFTNEPGAFYCMHVPRLSRDDKYPTCIPLPLVLHVTTGLAS